METLDGVQLLWFDDWYDGPTSGLAEWQGRDYWFNTANDSWPTERPRQFVLIRVPEAELARERAIHRDFEEMVGTHHCEHLSPAERQLVGRIGETDFWELHPPSDEDRFRHHVVVGRFTWA